MSAKNSNATTLNPPSTFTKIGEITKVSQELESKGKRYHMVQLNDTAFPVSAKFLLNNKSFLTEGELVAITFQTTIKDTTTYVDKAGDIKYHDNNGDSIVTVRRATKLESLKRIENVFMQENISQAASLGLGMLYGTALR